MKPFLITVDTEGDNLWENHAKNKVTTENARYIKRFQSLCDSYGFKPVYLTNCEMALDTDWVNDSKRWEREGKCEIGMHLHAWNTPPEYELENRFGGAPYITEYPLDIIEQKTAYMMNLLSVQYETQIVSHRSGRWATSKEYFDILAKNGIRIDCSVTPGLNLSNLEGFSKNCGNDYRRSPKNVYKIHPDILEIPMTTRLVHHAKAGTLKHRVKTLLAGDSCWLRPIRNSLNSLTNLAERVISEGNGDYLEFMIHSSELMPGGSPYFKDSDAVENLYDMLNNFFLWVSERGYCGMTLKDYAKAMPFNNDEKKENI